jgi:hypothetical protein
MEIFSRTFDLLTWLLAGTNAFPRAHRHSSTRRLLDAAFDLPERLEEANFRQGAARQERLGQSHKALARVKWRLVPRHSLFAALRPRGQTIGNLTSQL